jgi:hypothetical protein
MKAGVRSPPSSPGTPVTIRSAANATLGHRFVTFAILSVAFELQDTCAFVTILSPDKANAPVFRRILQI